MRVWKIITGGMNVLLLCVLLSPTAAAGILEDVKPNADAEQSTHEESASGEYFHNHRTYVGVTAGAGYGLEVFGSSVNHHMALASAQYGWFFNETLGEDSRFEGNFELLADLYGGTQFHPRNRYVFGFAPSMRYNFITGSPWLPFIDGGLGVAYTNIEEPDLSTKFQFIVQVGAGTRYFFSEDLALIFHSKWFHLSNAGIREPNRGVNTLMFMIGVNWFLE